MSTVSPGAPGTPSSASSGEPPSRLPLRWAFIVLATVTAGIACYAAGGIPAAVIGASAVAVALHSMLA